MEGNFTGKGSLQSIERCIVGSINERYRSFVLGRSTTETLPLLVEMNPDTRR